MTRPIIAGMIVFALAAQAPIPAIAQPRERAAHDARYDRGRPPPPGWGERQWRYRQDYVRRHDSRDNHDDAVIAGLLGFALGAAIAGSRQDKDRVESRRNDREWIAACARRYRSFDPASGTYLGRDGLRHYCR